MNSTEMRDLVISAVVLAFVFGLVYAGGLGNLTGLIITFPIALIAVSLGFVLHELGHRYMARKFQFHAEYRMWKQGLLLALILSPLGFVFAAPGAVMIYPKTGLFGVTHPDRKSMGLISVTGPVMNILLAIAFLILYVLFPSAVFSFGAYINVWLALFNLLPFPPLDGSKIFAWDRKIWIAMFVLTIILFSVMRI